MTTKKELRRSAVAELAAAKAALREASRARRSVGREYALEQEAVGHEAMAMGTPAPRVASVALKEATARRTEARAAVRRAEARARLLGAVPYPEAR